MSCPMISRISPANPGETVRIFGENLKHCRVYLHAPEERIQPEDAFETPPLPDRPEEAIAAEVLGGDDQVLYADIPYTIPHGCFLLWVVGEEGEACGVVNRPEVWNQSLKKARPDDRFTLYGRSFFGFDQAAFLKTTCVMKHLESGAIYRMRWGVCQDIQQNMPGQNDHKSDYRLPAELPAGEYLYSMTNGTGGAWGWSECRPLTVTEKRDYLEYCRLRWNAECRQNITFDMSGVSIVRLPADCGDGLTDVTDRLQAAIREAAVTGGAVILPAGRFGISRTVELLPGVVLKGAGAGATTLTVTEGSTLAPVGMPPVAYASRASDGKNWSRDWLPYMNRENNTPMVWIRTDAGIEDMTLEGGSGTVILTLIGNEDESPSRGVFFNRVCFENGINSALYLHGTDFDVSYHGVMTTGHTEDLTFYKCSITASFPLMILPAQCRDLRMIGNRFEVSPRQTGDCVFAGGIYGAVITENSFLCGRRSLISQQGMSDCWVFQNRSEGVANTTNANEEYMSEYGQSAWIGNATEVGADYVRVGFPLAGKRLLQRGTVGENLHEHRWFLMILKGRGLGQYRTVTGVEGDRILLDRPWEVLPDADTCFNLITASHHNIWALNFAGTGSGNSQFVYGSGIENIVVGHSMLMASGISMYAMMPQRNEAGELIDLGVVAFNSFTNCDARYSGMGLCLWTNESWSLLDDREVDYPNQIGNIVRWNSFIGGADSEYVKNQTVWTPVKIAGGLQSFGDYCLMEKNLLAGYEAGIHIRYGSRGNLLRNNRYRGNATDILDDGSGSLLLDEGEGLKVAHGGQRNKNGGWYYE